MTIDRATIGLAERILTILDEGGFAATYKYALLIGLIDVCLEKKGIDNVSVETVVLPREIAPKVVEYYWPQVRVYPNPPRVLRQVGSGSSNHRTILSEVTAFRGNHRESRDPPLGLVRATSPVAYEELLEFVERKLISMPIPRLQRVGRQNHPFLYHCDWDQSIREDRVKRFQATRTGFDERLLLLPGVADQLCDLSGLLRPIIQRQWTRWVAKHNRLEEARLEDFLFGASRVALAPVTVHLVELQAGDCFYCRSPLSTTVEVDHFVPWTRHVDNGLYNLVAAHGGCNARKRDYLAVTEHVERWVERAVTARGKIDSLAASIPWEAEHLRTGLAAAAIYGRMPDGALGWAKGDEFQVLDRPRIMRALAGWPGLDVAA